MEPEGTHEWWGIWGDSSRVHGSRVAPLLGLEAFELENVPGYSGRPQEMVFEVAHTLTLILVQVQMASAVGG